MNETAKRAEQVEYSAHVARFLLSACGFNENEKLPKRINFVWATFAVK